MEDYLTVEEAEGRLKKVVPLMEKARKIKREIESIAAAYDYDTVLLEQEKPKISKLVGQLSERLDELEELGCYIKDLDVGLIDFLSTFEGRDNFLCWKLGEPHISHWHETHEGVSSRQDILDMTQLDFEFTFEEVDSHR